MTRITHTQIEITKNPLLKVPIVVPQWEAHVVLALWGEDANITGTEVIDRDVPEVNDEFTRLANKYGPRDEDIPFVARVYGGFGPGLRALANEFDVSVAGSNVQSRAVQVTERTVETVAPDTLAGFAGSQAPIAPETFEKGTDNLQLETEKGDTELTDAQIDAIDNVPALDGNTVDGVPVKDFLNDVSDLVVEESEDDKAA